MKRVLILCGLGLLSLNAQAQDANASVAERLQECAALESGVARLDCYDALALDVAAARGDGEERGRGREMAEARGEQARERADEVRQRAEEARERAQQQRDERRRQRDDAAEAAENEDGKRYITIVERWQDPRGFWHFVTESGAEWEQTDADSRFPMNDDARYYIESGFFNSHSLSHDDTNRRLRIRRVN